MPARPGSLDGLRLVLEGSIDVLLLDLRRGQQLGLQGFADDLDRHSLGGVAHRTDRSSSVRSPNTPRAAPAGLARAMARGAHGRR